MRFLLLLALACASTPLAAQSRSAPKNPQIDYAGYRQLAIEVEDYRAGRMLSWAEFAAAAAEPNVLILDARSERQFAAGHLEGAVNLPLPEFSVEALAELIGEQDRPILIYCNNNFSDDRPPVMLKSLQLALNISTFVHLVGYGYRNVRELDDVIDMDDPSIPWVSARGSAQARAGR